MKGLRNGISCSTGSELTLAIVRSYYRLLAAKADNTASRSGKTQAFINSISTMKGFLAVRVNVSAAGVVRDFAWAEGSTCGSQNHMAVEVRRDIWRPAQNRMLTALSSWALSISKVDTTQPFWTACFRNSYWGEKFVSLLLSFSLTCSLLWLLCFCWALSLVWTYLAEMVQPW